MSIENRSTSSLSRSRERARVRARELRAASTDAERLLWSRLRDRHIAGAKFRRQHSIGPFFADFACIDARLIVEIDGGQHYEVPGEASDTRRTALLRQEGFEVLRFSNREVPVELDAVLAKIHAFLVTRRHGVGPHPSPLPQAGEGAMQKEHR